MIKDEITKEDIKYIFSDANGKADILLKKRYLHLRIEQLGIDKFFNQLCQDDITTMIFKTRKEDHAEETLKDIVGGEKKITTQKSIETVFSDKNGGVDCGLQKSYLTELYSCHNINIFLNAVTNDRIDEFIMATWEYNDSKEILREMFKQTDKYNNNQSKKKRIDSAIAEWKELDLGELKWPFAAKNFDDVVHKLNRREDIRESEKDDILSTEVKKFRRMKDISSLKNDYIEYLIFEKNINIIPTFGNKRGVDFYIDGIPYDQKVSKSVGSDFIKQYKDNYREKAIKEPALLAKSLYEHQDVNRFGNDPRLLVVYLDDDMSTDEIEKKLKTTDFSQPMSIVFEYPGSDNVMKKYSTSCYLVLLYR